MGRREPVLPVLTRGRPSGASCSSLPSTSAVGGLVPKRQHGLWERTALLVVVAVLVASLAACTAAAAVSCYALSIIYEPSTAVQAAAAQAQAAALQAAATVPLASGSQRAGLAGGLESSAGNSSSAGVSSNSSSSSQYTVVVMSYSKRLSTLPLVLNKLGSCPSGGARAASPSAACAAAPPAAATCFSRHCHGSRPLHVPDLSPPPRPSCGNCMCGLAL